MTDAQLLEWYDKMKDTEAVFFRKTGLEYDFLKVKDLMHLVDLRAMDILKNLTQGLISIKSPAGGDVIMSFDDFADRISEVLKQRESKSE